MTLLLALVVRSSLVLLAGLLLTSLLGRRSAALRHFVLATTILAATAVVPLSLVLPAWEVDVPAPVPSAPLSEASAPLAMAGNGNTTARRVEPREQRQTGAPPLVIVWMAGFIIAAGMLLTGILRLTRIASRAHHVQEYPWALLTRAIATAYGLRRTVIVLQTNTPELLATWGALRPCVLIPRGAQDWPEDRVGVVLRHELAHIRRHDWIVQIIAEALLAVVWFNPVMWIACRRLRRESEQACDDAVLEGGVAAREYAAHLLELARQCRRP
jgi:beta-lactamase regulating signal transducer with metallopeptidase domain